MVLIKAFPWDFEMEVGGWGGLGPLYDGCLREVDRAQPQWADPLMVPHTEEMDERPLITLTKTHSCIHIDKYTLRSHI